MRSISCALISYVMFYIAVHTIKSKWRLRSVLTFLSLCMLAASIGLMVAGC